MTRRWALNQSLFSSAPGERWRQRGDSSIQTVWGDIYPSWLTGNKDLPFVYIHHFYDWFMFWLGLCLDYSFRCVLLPVYLFTAHCSILLFLYVVNNTYDICRFAHKDIFEPPRTSNRCFTSIWQTLYQFLYQTCMYKIVTLSPKEH
jgi:hypothetical protein